MPASKKFRLTEIRFDYSYRAYNPTLDFPYRASDEFDAVMETLVSAQVDCDAAVTEAMNNATIEGANGKYAVDKKMNEFIEYLNSNRVAGSSELTIGSGRYIENSQGGHQKASLILQDDGANPDTYWKFTMPAQPGDHYVYEGFVSVYMKMVEIPVTVVGP